MTHKECRRTTKEAKYSNNEHLKSSPNFDLVVLKINKGQYFNILNEKEKYLIYTDSHEPSLVLLYIFLNLFIQSFKGCLYMINGMHI